LVALLAILVAIVIAIFAVLDDIFGCTSKSTDPDFVGCDSHITTSSVLFILSCPYFDHYFDHYLAISVNISAILAILVDILAVLVDFG
jgi:hypothetical protein